MSVSERELEKRVLEAGENLLDQPPPSSTSRLLELLDLDEVFCCLSEVEQNPPISMKNALSPSIKALIAPDLFEHSDLDVKVAVTACISQIVRITSPDTPYDAEKMKVILILETVSRFNFVTMMLDLGCNALLIEMFQQFLKAIRDHHPIKVFLYMENIMTLVLEENVDIPPELLSPILNYVRKDDEVSHLSQRLAEQDLSNCAHKLKTYLTEAVKASGVSLDKYSNVVVSICEGTFSCLKQNEVPAHQHEAIDVNTQRRGVMSTSEKALKKRLLKAGKDVLDPRPPSSRNSLKRHLSRLSTLSLCLAKVEEDHPSSLKDALSPSIQALVAAKLFKHSDDGVNVAVAACITQVIRITSPDTPYDNDKMKLRSCLEVLQLIVSSFQHLSYKGNSYYVKKILEVVAKARVYVLMLDLGCNALLIEMFQHFLKAIRDDHPMNFFLCMENIMTAVLEESKDIPTELLSVILDYVKKDDEIPQVSQRLMEQVLSRCGSKLKMCLTEAVKASGVSLDEYSNVVALICEETPSALKQNEVVVHQNEDNQKTAEVSTPEQTCVHAASSSLNKNGHEAVSQRQEIVAGVNTQAKRAHEMVQLPVVEEDDPAEAETRTHKRPRVESCSLNDAHDEMENTTVAEGEHKRVLQACSVSDQLAKVRMSIVDTITSVRQFSSELETKEDLAKVKMSIVDILTSVRQLQSEIKKKEDNLGASLQEEQSIFFVPDLNMTPTEEDDTL